MFTPEYDPVRSAIYSLFATDIRDATRHHRLLVIDADLANELFDHGCIRISNLLTYATALSRWVGEEPENWHSLPRWITPTKLMTILDDANHVLRCADLFFDVDAQRMLDGYVAQLPGEFRLAVGSSWAEPIFGASDNPDQDAHPWTTDTNYESRSDHQEEHYREGHVEGH